MKKLAAIISAVVLTAALSQAFAQPDPVGGDPTDPGLTNTPPPPPPNPPPPVLTNPPPTWWTNVPPGPTGTNFWWTNLPPRFSTNLPPVWTNSGPRVVSPIKPVVGNPPHTQPPQLPADVQTLVNKFQTDSTALMSQLKTATADQRQQLLQQLEQLRAQLRQQLADMRQQAKDQAKQQAFGNGDMSLRANHGAPPSSTTPTVGPSRNTKSAH